MDVTDRVRERYLARTPESRRLHERAKRWLPGGDTRTINHFTPHPVFMARGTGCVMTDVDGNEYLDFYNNMSATVHGHGHPALVKAATEQVELGTALGTPTEVQLRHASLLCDRVASFERLRYCNSGTEATMLALRVARSFTGRDTIVKIDGGYHGIHNDVEINMFTGMTGPSFPQPGLPDYFPRAQLPSGVPASTLGSVLLLPYNDLPAAGELLTRHADRIAALIVEPMLGAAGAIPAEVGYLRGLRDLTTEHGVLLIFDECATFRLGPLQNRYRIRPDLTSLSKIIGGGLPMGAFGGRADVMAQFDPIRPDPLYHASAMAGNNLSLTIGLAALETFGPVEVDELNARGDWLIDQLPKTAREVGVALQVSGIGSLAHLHWGAGPIRQPADTLALRTGLAELLELVHLELLNRGIYLSRRGMFTLSLPMTRPHLETFRVALRDTLITLRPYLEATLPHLLVEA